MATRQGATPGSKGKSPMTGKGKGGATQKNGANTDQEMDCSFSEN